MRPILIGMTMTLLLLASVGWSQERLTLTTPIARPSQTQYRLSSLFLDWDHAEITVTLTGQQAGDVITRRYQGATATAFMVALNKANLATRSLSQRIFDRLIADAVLAGSVTGTVP